MLIFGTGLQDKQLKLLELIEGLGEYIASEDGGIRGKSKNSNLRKCRVWEDFC